MPNFNRSNKSFLNKRRGELNLTPEDIPDLLDPNKENEGHTETPTPSNTGHSPSPVQPNTPETDENKPIEEGNNPPKGTEETPKATARKPKGIELDVKKTFKIDKKVFKKMSNIRTEYGYTHQDIMYAAIVDFLNRNFTDQGKKTNPDVFTIVDDILKNVIK